MRHAASLAAAMALAACAAATVEPALAPGRPVALANPGFEQAAGAPCAPGWQCAMHADPESYRFQVRRDRAAAGGASLCIERAKPEPWGIAGQAVPGEPLRGKRVRFSLAVLTEGADGNGAGPMIAVHNAGGTVVASASRLAGGTHGWRRLAAELDVPATAYQVEVGALLEGPGRACVDEARLEVLEPAPVPALPARPR